jgi:hypothetical protein
MSQLENNSDAGSTVLVWTSRRICCKQSAGSTLLVHKGPSKSPFLVTRSVASGVVQIYVWWVHPMLVTWSLVSRQILIVHAQNLCKCICLEEKLCFVGALIIFSYVLSKRSVLTMFLPLFLLTVRHHALLLTARNCLAKPYKMNNTGY